MHLRLASSISVAACVGVTERYMQYWTPRLFRVHHAINLWNTVHDFLLMSSWFSPEIFSWSIWYPLSRNTCVHICTTVYPTTKIVDLQIFSHTLDLSTKIILTIDFFWMFTTTKVRVLIKYRYRYQISHKLLVSSNYKQIFEWQCYNNYYTI